MKKKILQTALLSLVLAGVAQAGITMDKDMSHGHGKVKEFAAKRLREKPLDQS